MHPYTSSPFSELELDDILDGAIDAIDAIEDIDDDKLCLPDDSIEALQFNPLDDSCFFPLVPKLENDFEVGELFLQGGVEDSDSPPWGIVCKKFRSGRLGKQLWSLYPPLWHLNSTATCFEAKKTCVHCRAQETSQWRKGPAGPATLCNACGIRFRSGRLLPEYRPIASPTYNNTDYSNRHKKVLKIRTQKNGYSA